MTTEKINSQSITKEAFDKMKKHGVFLRSPEHLLFNELDFQKVLEDFRKAYEQSGEEGIYNLLEEKEYYVGISKADKFLPKELDLKVDMSSDEPEELNNLWEDLNKTFQLKIKSLGERGFTFKEKGTFEESMNPNYSVLSWEYADLPSKDEEVTKFLAFLSPELQNKFIGLSEKQKVKFVWEFLQDHLLEDGKYKKEAHMLVKSYVESIVGYLKQN